MLAPERPDPVAEPCHPSDPSTAAGRIAHLVRQAWGLTLPVRLRAWDGSEAGPVDVPYKLVLTSPQALRRLVWQPNELGAARAYVAGEIQLEGLERDADLDRVLADPRLTDFADAARRTSRLTLTDRLRLITGALQLHALGRPPRPPEEEARLSGTPHSKRRDAAAIAHHYDVGNAFYRLLLGPSMVYSCGYWRSTPDGNYTVTDAQRDKLALICGKLGLRPGQRLLDVGCGWGSLVMHAAEHHDVHAVGITMSREQAELARARVAEAGLAGKVEIRVQDYRDADDGPYDAIASVGMAEHLGAVNYPTYVAQLRRLLRPGGRLLHHQITTIRRPPRGVRRRHQFIDRYIFPDGELIGIGNVLTQLENGGLEVRDVESLREHYALTLRAWSANLAADWDTAVELTSPARARAWQLYLAGSAASFATGRIGVHQVVAIAPLPGGGSGLPGRRAQWLPDLR